MKRPETRVWEPRPAVSAGRTTPRTRRAAWAASGSDAIDGPTKDAESVPGGGDATGPTPGGVPQEGDTESDPDTSTDSTE